MNIIRQTYPGMCSDSFTQEEINAYFAGVGGIPNGLPVGKVGEAEKLTLAAPGALSLKAISNYAGWTSEQHSRAIQFLSSKPLPDERLSDLIKGCGEFGTKLQRAWTETGIKSLNLTSVGMALGHANAIGRRDMPIDLTTWL